MVDTEDPASANQPKNADQLEQSIEEWRASAIRAIDKRIALYNPKLAHQKAPPATSSASPRTRNSEPHRALDVVEILEQILFHTSPRAHYKAFNVSKRWREIVVHMLGTQYHVPYPCPPVEYGDIIPSDLDWLQPPEDEATIYQNAVNRTPGSDQNMLIYPFITALWTQARIFPQPVLDGIRQMASMQSRFKNLPEFSSGSGEARWMDLSQFRVNPYFVELFGNCFRSTESSYTIIIKPHILEYLEQLETVKGTVREQLVHGMYLTQPPCKVLRTYAVSMFSDGLQMIGQVHQTNGVRIGDLLHMLQVDRKFSKAIDQWRTRSENLRKAIADHTPDVFSFSDEEKLWACPGFPKLVILFEALEQPHPTFAQDLYDITQCRKSAHKKEWHEYIQK
ncbi:uncharacterized protein J4E92_001167 [Alternaria infectoria]|uniref:uncharacterized protein n=1 Tax=Alternaria infectoria TaxID=45303 RepID=UPI00221ED879|nr:uncharacterized protein J4E92_001167 [Alternaria infectoria]KAI4939881.1 hypothetical protein J4E92_001167 [Alternaria infectoria]